MEVYTVKTGRNLTNCYLIQNSGHSFVIDPGDDGQKILEFIEEKNLNIEGIILTHGHFDHIGAVEFLREKLELKVYIHHLDNPYLTDSKKNLSSLMGDRIEANSADKLLADGDRIGDFVVIHTPGHTPGGISLYAKEEEVLFSGDTIFNNAYGRTDFPGADQQTLFASINILLKLPDNILVYPGHGPSTTIGDFRRYIS